MTIMSNKCAHLTTQHAQGACPLNILKTSFQLIFSLNDVRAVDDLLLQASWSRGGGSGNFSVFGYIYLNVMHFFNAFCT